MKIRQALKELRIPAELKLKFKKLEGTRHIIQFENKEYVFTLSKTFKPKITSYGITNRCEDGQYILFLDYDKIYKELMYKDLNNLLNKFPLTFGNFYIATTEPEEILENDKIKGSYHVVCFTKAYKYQVEEALKICNIDPHYREIPGKTAHKAHVLRITEKYWKTNGKIQKQKPIFNEIYPKKQRQVRKKESRPHYKILEKEWEIKDNFKHNFDNTKKIELHKYSTPKVMLNG